MFGSRQRMDDVRFLHLPSTNRTCPDSITRCTCRIPLLQSLSPDHRYRLIAAAAAAKEKFQSIPLASLIFRCWISDHAEKFVEMLTVRRSEEFGYEARLIVDDLICPSHLSEDLHIRHCCHVGMRPGVLNDGMQKHLPCQFLHVCMYTYM